MSLRLNQLAPNSVAISTEGEINFYEWIEKSWVILFSHPKDFTPVCTTELGILSQMQDQFLKKNCKIIGLSVDSVDKHKKWIPDIEDISKTKLNYPLIGDEDLKISKLYNMLPHAEEGDSDNRTAVDNLTVRSVFIIGPDKRIKMILTYPMSTGRNFNEILRVLESCQLTQIHKVATPANWKKGDDVIIVPALDNDRAKEIFPNGWKTVKEYLRKVADPS